MGKYVLIVIWENGEKSEYKYNSYRAAEQGEKSMKMANGNQIAWTGIR